MIDALDENSLINEIVMSSEGRKLVLVVEGDLEILFFEPRVITSEVSVVNAHGKPRVLAAAQAIDTLNDVVVVLLDKDFDEHREECIDGARFVYTPKYNLEAQLLLEEGVFETLWTTHISISRPAHVVEDARECCVKAATVIGALRLTSQAGNYGLSLSSLPFHEIAEGPECLTISFPKLIEECLHRSRDSRFVANMKRRDGNSSFEHRSIRRLDKEVQATLARLTDFDLVSGHDVSAALNSICSRVRKSGFPSTRDLEMQAAMLYPGQHLNTDEPFVGLVESASLQGHRLAWR